MFVNKQNFREVPFLVKSKLISTGYVRRNALITWSIGRYVLYTILCVHVRVPERSHSSGYMDCDTSVIGHSNMLTDTWQRMGEREREREREREADSQTKREWERGEAREGGRNGISDHRSKRTAITSTIWLQATKSPWKPLDHNARVVSLLAVAGEKCRSGDRGVETGWPKAVLWPLCCTPLTKQWQKLSSP